MANSINVPKLGMQLTKHQSQLTQLEYSVALNANIAAVDGSVMTITNEPSNLLCSRFKPNYNVIGVLPINIEKKAIFFLTSPQGDSEIGVINNVTFTDSADREIYCKDCNKPLLEDTPLELQTPVELCTYTTIISDNCLNFSIDFPISATYRITQDGLTIFFASKNNHFRYLNLFDIPRVQVGFDSENCNLPLYSNQLDCNALKIVPDYSIPCTEVVDVISGGNLQAGVYQFTAAYAEDIFQNNTTSRVAITDYFPVNNPTPIVDNSVARVEINYTVDKAIKFTLNNVDTDFNYLSLVVLKTVDNITTPYLIGAFPITSNTFTYTYTGNNNDDEIAIPIDTIFRRRAVYTSARGVTEANNFLFWYDLEEQRPLNLQQFVSKIPLKWRTIEQNEDFYSNPISNNFVSYLRDEVVPFGIEFQFLNGYATATFPFVGREPNQTDLEEIPNSDPNYLPTDTSCTPTERKYRWQFYNTATEIGDAPCQRTFSIFDKFTNKCSINPYKEGKFSYVESTLNYPNNPETWGDLCGKPIRHFKFPDNCISPIIDNADNTPNKIYPIGISVDPEDVKQALQDAVSQGYITEEEKKQIVSYRIKRGNRVGNKSIVAKGIITDILQSQAYTVSANGDNLPLPGEFIYFPNYGFNDVSNPDPYLTNLFPFQTTGRYTFQSPETTFNNPLLPTEVKTEFIYGGTAQGRFSEVEKSSKYVLLDSGAYLAANLLGGAEAVADIIIAASSATPTDYPFTTALAIAQIVATDYPSYTQDWLNIIKNLGVPYNPAIYYTAVGTYNKYCCIDPVNQFQQKIENSTYLQPGNISLYENNNLVRINNWNRESSVYIRTQNDIYNLCSIPDDNSKQDFNCTLDRDEPTRDIKQNYVSLKNYVPDQYGTIDQIEWIDTGYCGTIDWNNTQENCDIIFGGDTYLSRFAYKKKFQFFTTDRVNGNINDDVTYKQLANVATVNYYFNNINLNSVVGGISVIDDFRVIWDEPDVNLMCDGNPNSMYHSGKALMYNYSIPYFIVESGYNLNYIYAENDLAKNFYPRIKDVPYWTQQFRVPISEDNYYFYNNTYSKQNKENPYYILKDNFEQAKEDQRRIHQNRAIYSSQNDWLTYSANDYYDFPLNDGRLIGMKGIEQQSVLVTQENSSSVFNAFVTVNTSLTTAQITTGDIFAAKPRQYYKTDLGFAGATQQPIISTPYGHFYVDTQNPAIMQLGGDSLKDITADTKNKTVKQWFINNLPFNITKDFPEIDGILLNNPYKDFGITLGWDNKFKRLFITKKDYSLKPEYQGLITYTNGQFTLDNTPISVANLAYFCDKSWTIAYTPLLDQFVSFYSFKPNYYISNENYFSTGYADGLWNHLLTEKSYQVFNGVKEDFLIDYATTNKLNNNTLQSISYRADFRRFQGNQDWATINDKTFNQALVYTQNQTTGILNLIVKQPNNVQQNYKYISGIVNNDATDILVANIENNWRFNTFKDISLDNNQPILMYFNPDVKQLNQKAISYVPKYFSNSLRNNYFSIRLINSEHTNYNILLYFNNTQQQNSPI